MAKIGLAFLTVSGAAAVLLAIWAQELGLTWFIVRRSGSNPTTNDTYSDREGNVRRYGDGGVDDPAR